VCRALPDVSLTAVSEPRQSSAGGSACSAICHNRSGVQHPHSLIRSLSGQETARAVLERLRGQNVRQQFRLAMKPGRPSVSLPQHLRIIEALCAGDPEAAEAAVRDHLRSVIEALPTVDAPPGRRFDAL
jgi:hypothetical protein